MNVVVDNLLTSYELSGKGKLVLLLHGWADSSKGLAGLARTLDGYQVLAVDLPGFGGTQPPASAWDLDDYARFTAAVLDKLKLAQPYAVIGHSNGGALAIRAVSMGLLKPRKLVLLAASGVRTNSAVKRLTLKILAKTGNIATLWMPERYRMALRKGLYGAAGSDMLVQPEL
ncbi:MAG TPA: alpha/beta fold hydrolase, partial [Candidatus Saccharimonadales bacterium]|nr:alpha/beta fold hydrolase [Candidatus Saccharimonadales bacterium]